MDPRRSAWWLVAIVTALVVSGCSDPVEPAETPTAMPTAGAMPTSSQPSPTVETTPGSPITLRTSDGVRIAGREFGEGRVGVVLGHQIDGDQSDWWDFAEMLADEGYAALSINFRGYCPQDGAGCSGDGGTGDSWRDLIAGATFLRDHGARRIVLVGASMGGTAAVVAASEAGDDADGVITLSAPTDCCGMVVARSTVERVQGPMLFLAGRFDGDAPASARRFARWAGPDGTVVILASGEHGRDLMSGLATPQVQRRTTDLIMTFLARIAGG